MARSRNIYLDSNGVERAPSGYRCGASHPKAKLTNEQVLEIRRLRAEEGVAMRELAARFGASFWTITKIARGERRNVDLRSYDE